MWYIIYVFLQAEHDFIFDRKLRRRIQLRIVPLEPLQINANPYASLGLRQCSTRWSCQLCQVALGSPISA
jgi:hypothetical protein